MTFPAFKAGDSALRGSNGGFDFHTPPPYFNSSKASQEDSPGVGCHSPYPLIIHDSTNRAGELRFLSRVHSVQLSSYLVPGLSSPGLGDSPRGGPVVLPHSKYDC